MKKQFISSTIYIAIAKYSVIFIQLIITAILARLLTPEDYGIIAMANVFIVFFNMLGDMGIGPAIIQNKSLSDYDIDVIFSFTICIGFVLSLIFGLISPLVAAFYNAPILINLFWVLSISIFLACINIVPNALLLKNKQFRALMFRQLFIQIICGIISVILALSGYGIFTLAINFISTSLIAFIINIYINPIKIRFLNKKSLKKIASFSTYQFLFIFINYFSRNSDNLLIGKFFSSTALGYYEKSYRLMLLPIQNLTFVLTPVIQPFFSEFQHDKKEIFTKYLKIVNLLALIGFPLSVFLFFTAKELILIIFGDQWIDSIPVFKIFACSIGLQIISSSSGSIFQAANNTKHLFISGLLSAVVMIGAILIGVFILKSLEGIAYMLLCAFLINFIQCYYLLIKITLRQSVLLFIKELIQPIIIACIIFFVEYAIYINITINNLFISFIVKAIAAGLIMLPAMMKKFKEIKK